MSDSRPPAAPNPAVTAATPPARPVNGERPAATLPRTFGRYRVEGRLGRGGMGTVFKVHDTQLDRTVALKVPFIRNDPGARERFYREARAAAAIHHANICPVFDVGEQDGIPYLTMAFIEGRSLSEAIAAGQVFSPTQVALLLRKVALGMQEAHARGVVHRDLKPSNILLRPPGEPVITDFGLARRTDAEPAGEALTRKGEIVGTLEYMSPEQLHGDSSAVGPESDVYALGVVLYELLAGRRPFTGGSTRTVAAILLHEPPPPSEVRPGVPAELDEICRKAMAKDPAARYPGMAQLAAALAGFLRGRQQAPGAGAAQTAEAPPTPPPSATTRPVEPAAPRPVKAADSPPRSGPKGPPRSGAKRPRSGRRRAKAGKKPPLAVIIGVAAAALVLVVGILVVVVMNRPRGEAETARTTPAVTPPPPSDRPTPPPAPPPADLHPAPPAEREKPPAAAAERGPALAVRCRPEALALSVGEDHKVSVEVRRQGYQGPVVVRWVGPKEVRVSPAGPLTVRPGDPDPVLTLRLMGEPADAEPGLDVTAGPLGQSQIDPVKSRLALRVTAGPCARIIPIADRPDAVGAVAFAPDGSMALVGSAGRATEGTDPAGEAGVIRAWGLPRGEVLSPLSGAGRVAGLTVSGDGKTALSIGADQTVSVWDLAKGRRVLQSPKQLVRVLGAALSPDAKHGLALYPGFVVKVNLDRFQADGQPIRTAALTGSDLEDAVRAIAVSGDRKGLVGGVDGKLFLLDLKGPVRPKPLVGHREAVLAAAFSPNGKQAATGGGGVLKVGSLQPGQENAVCLWDIESAALRWKADDQASSVVCVAFGPEGRLVASGGSGGEVKVWDAAGGRAVATFTGHTGRVLALVFTSDGKGLWSAAADGTLREWRVP